MYASAHLEAAALSRPEGAALAMAAGVLPAFASVHSAAAVPCAALSRPGGVVPAMAAEALPVYASARPEAVAPCLASVAVTAISVQRRCQ